MKNDVIPKYCLVAHQRLTRVEESCGHLREGVGRIEEKLDTALVKLSGVSERTAVNRVKIGIIGAVAGVLGSGAIALAKILL